MAHRPTKLAAYLLLTISTVAQACECYSLTKDEAVTAKHVFSFRVVKMWVEADAAHRLQGEIEVFETLKGNGEIFSAVGTGIGSCCGTKLVPGMTYFAFTSESGPTFEASGETLFQFPAYGNTTAPSPANSEAIADMLSGKSDLAEHLWETSRAQLRAEPPSECVFVANKVSSPSASSGKPISSSMVERLLKRWLGDAESKSVCPKTK